MAYRGDDPAPLLPASLKVRLHGWLWKVLGFLLLTACAAMSASLLTWSVADPSLSHATSGATRNLLGPPGAILSDLIMQMLGLAGVFVLLPPLFWALQLLTAQPPPSLRGKLVLAPLAVLFLAGALSSLPKASVWPLYHHGYGGLLGDLGLGLLASLLAHVNPDRSAAAAGLFCFAAGLMALMWSLGLTQRDLKLICQANARPRLDAMAGWWRGWQGQVWRPRPPAPIGPDPTLIREPPMFHVKQSPVEEAPVAEESDYDTEVPDSGRGPAFDHLTDQQTSAIAERFKPEKGTASEPVVERREPELPAVELVAGVEPVLHHRLRPGRVVRVARQRGD
jgi:S-DNA-T family DNA segregation ATPase FtsK/SpoIIIE